jgi:hypothetical protein
MSLAPHTLATSRQFREGPDRDLLLVTHGQKISEARNLVHDDPLKSGGEL